MLVPMSKIYTVGLKAQFFPTLKLLQRYGKLHIANLREDIDSGALPIEPMNFFERSDKQMSELEALSQRGSALIVNLFGNAHALDNTCSSEVWGELGLPEMIAATSECFEGIEPQAAELLSKVSESEEEYAELRQYEPLLTKVEPTVRELVADKDVFSMAVLIEARYAAAVGELQGYLRDITDGTATVVTKALDEGMMAVIIIVEPHYKVALRDLISREEFNQIKLPDTFNELPFSEALTGMRLRIEELIGIIEGAKCDVAIFAEENRLQLCEATNEVNNRISQLEAIDCFGETRYAFVMAGYLPTSEVATMREVFKEELGEALCIEERVIEPREFAEVPVQLENSKALKPFQTALGIWGKPMYGAFDPTWVLAISFPIIFGMIVGDFGYGSLILLISIFLLKKYPKNPAAQTVGGLFLPVGIMTMLFGLFYFELFGDLAHIYIPGLNQVKPIQVIGDFTIPLIRTEGASRTIFLFGAIGFGLLEVIIGLILGIVNAKRGGHNKHILEKAGILTILITAVALGVMAFVPQLTASLGDPASAFVTYTIYVLLGFGVIVTLMGGGIMGAIETIESVAHIASYIRIMAVGLVGALLADASNKLMFETMPNAAGVIIALILHILNFAIIMFSPSIHALRLNFLEFFGKFWEAGRVSYKPFVRSGKAGKS